MTMTAKLTNDQTKRLAALAEDPSMQKLVAAHEGRRTQQRAAILETLATTRAQCEEEQRAKQEVINDLRSQADELRRQLAEVCGVIEDADRLRSLAFFRAERAENVAVWNLLPLGGEQIKATRSHLNTEKMLALQMSGDYVMPRGPDGVAQHFDGKNVTVESAKVKTAGEFSAVTRDVEVKSPMPLAGTAKFPQAATRLELIDALLAELKTMEMSAMAPAAIEARCAEMVALTARANWMPTALVHPANINAPKMPRAAVAA